MTLYEKYCALNLDCRLIGLEKTELTAEYFCTPQDARIIGWENGGIHYCFIRGHRDMVFAVNPMPAGEKHVYPLAANFRDFLRLILACGSTTAVEQSVNWSREQFERFLTSPENAFVPGQQAVLDSLTRDLKLKPMEDPYGYVQEIQRRCPEPRIRFSHRYYDTLGLPRPDGSEREDRLMEVEPVVFTVVTKHKP